LVNIKINILKDFLDNKSISENAIGSYGTLKMLRVLSTLTSRWHNQSGAGFRLYWCWEYWSVSL